MKNILIASFLLISAAISAQPSYLGFETSIACGISAFHYQNVKGNPSMSINANGDFSYFMSLNDKWALGIGIGGDYFRSEMKFGQIQGQTPYTMKDGTRLMFSYAYKDYTESFFVSMITIPVEMRYEFSNKKITLSNNRQIVPHASFGLKFSMPLSGHYNGDGTLTTKGYFPDERRAVEDKPEQGFESNFAIWHYGDLDLKSALILSLKVGASYTTSEEVGLAFILSLYCDIGLNNMNKDTSTPPVEWTDIGVMDWADLDFHAVATSSRNQKLIPLAIGLRVTCATR